MRKWQGSKMLAGFSYSEEEQLFYTALQDGVLGFRLLDDGGIQAVRKIPQSLYLSQIEMFTAEPGYSEIHNVEVVNRFILLFFNNINKILVMDSAFGDIVGRLEMPGTHINWLSAHTFYQGEELFLYMTNDQPTEVWRFKLDPQTGFSSCAWR
jgi:hypothetical protein